MGCLGVCQAAAVEIPLESVQVAAQIMDLLYDMLKHFKRWNLIFAKKVPLGFRPTAKAILKHAGWSTYVLRSSLSWSVMEPLCFQPWSPWVMFRKVHLPKQPWDLGWASPEHQWRWPLQPLHRCGQPAAQGAQIISGVNLRPVMTNQRGWHGVSPVSPVSDNPYDSICIWYITYI